MPKEVNTYLPKAAKIHRLVSSHFPPINLFENVADPDDLDIVFALEAITNDRLREQVGDLSLLASEERVSGKGSTPVMAAFTHIGSATRFTNGKSYGVYYGANTLATAFAETIYHKEKFLAATNEPDTELTMRCYTNKVMLELHDIRAAKFSHLYTDDYHESQHFAKTLRKTGSNGLIYNSVRYSGGTCIAAFKPKTVSIPKQAGHYKYIWNGKKQKIEHVLSVNLIT